VTPFRVGLVGCGRLAEAGYLPAVRIASTPVRVVAVADPDPGRRAHLADLAADLATVLDPGEPVAGFADAATLVAGAEVDGLILATPAGTHVDDAALAAAAGVPTLVEKPPAADAAGAAALAALDPAPWIGLNRRFDPGAARVHGAVPAAGPVHLRLEIRYRCRSWSPVGVHDDALLDLGPHLVDLARWLTGADVVEVAAPVLTPERAELHVTLDRGPARLVAATDRPHTEIVELRARDGRVLARHRLGGLVANVRGRLGPAGPGALVETLASQLDAFAAAGRGAPPGELGTATDGLAAMLAVDAARTSADLGGRAVPVTPSMEA
jgi:predicted dehydrogenase